MQRFIAKILIKNSHNNIALEDFLAQRVSINSLSNDEASMINDVLSLEFCSAGRQKDDEPNEYGIELENAIDWVTNNIKE